ncbi:YcnI family copper-binding membrane protein [Jeongeupia chitinilytica]|uniref:Nuclear export factor GLE1 n=1 Tax=Jeongeupia chitinilytica TaxID=1041641 RepID=A0ABQ3H241_9NEIS|nr:YcnI family protein [Jeongeupia chitinilytica]GHD64779.1 nuclear export factor GLE1 [Jeongeupia chitinilytica]
MRVSPSAVLILSLLAGSAQAHIVLQQKYAPADTYYKAVFQVGHGCDGAATTAVSVRIPDGVLSAKPMPKPGWKLDIRSGKLKQPYEAHGKTVAEGVSEIRWSGSLPDAQFDEFVMQLKLPAEAGKLYFKVVQQCGKQTIEWTDVAGDDGAAPAHPAPVLELAPPAGAGHQHH